MIKIIMWFILFLCVVWIEIELIRMYVSKQQQQHKTFPCTYISGSCTIKPTYENCLKLGHIPDNECERRLNL